MGERMTDARGAAVAVALGFLGFCLLAMAVRGTYYDVWRALSITPSDGGANTHAPAGPGGGSRGPN